MPKTKEQTDEHPIIFSGWSIRRIFAGEKTQTRRIVKGYDQMLELSGGNWPWAETPDGEGYMLDFPYGATGDVLWVREAFRLPAKFDDDSPTEAMLHGRPSPALYCADGTSNHCGKWNPVRQDPPSADSNFWGRKRPSIHMPCELCRLRLRVEDVRVEPLQAITEADAVAEGIPKTLDLNALKFEVAKHAVEDLEARVTPRLAFRSLWESIHGTGAWEENPWVWIVAFSRIDTE
jgi:hypothetical protein